MDGWKIRGVVDAYCIYPRPQSSEAARSEMLVSVLMLGNARHDIQRHVEKMTLSLS
jgi:hypothetical protein